jgi:uncharacterized protein YaiI (UPF0178 family)
MSITIFIDADAAPKDVLSTARTLGQRYGANVITVSSINHQIQGDNHIQVDAHPQATDMHILGRIKKGEPAIVITQDYGLAAIALGKGAKALSPKGMEYTVDNIDLLLYERALHQRERKASVRFRGPKARTDEDRKTFALRLEALLSIRISDSL